MPKALFVPFAAVPVMVTSPTPVPDILELEYRETPLEPAPVPLEVPFKIIVPELVVTLERFTWRPRATSVPFAALPVIVTFPTPLVEVMSE